MTNKEAISVIENEIQIDVRLCTDEQVDRFQTALYMAISALRAEPTGDSLTLEQLRKMDGQPVWVERNEVPHDGKWFIVDHADVENPDKTLYTKEGVTYSDYGAYFTAYAYHPTHIDQDAWEPCKACSSEYSQKKVFQTGTARQTNADRIRAMSDEELAIALVKYEGTEKRRTPYGGHEHIFYGPNGEKCGSKAEAVGMWFVWLSKPAEED